MFDINAGEVKQDVENLNGQVFPKADSLKLYVLALILGLLILTGTPIAISDMTRLEDMSRMDPTRFEVSRVTDTNQSAQYADNKSQPRLPIVISASLKCNKSNIAVLLGTHHKTGTWFASLALKKPLQKHYRGRWAIWPNFDKDSYEIIKPCHKLLHFVRHPREIIISGYNYHKQGNENFLHGDPNYSKPGKCYFPCNRKWPELDTLIDEKGTDLQQKIDEIYHRKELLTKHKHSDLLQSLDLKEGLIFESCWEFCNIYRMIALMQLTLKRPNTIVIPFSWLKQNSRNFEQEVRHFLHLKGDQNKRPHLKFDYLIHHTKNHSTHTESDHIDHQQFIFMNEPIIQSLYIDLVKRYESLIEKHNPS